MPQGYCGFVGENLGSKQLESFAASLKMLHLFDNLGLVDIILYTRAITAGFLRTPVHLYITVYVYIIVYIYICVCVCMCVHVWAMQKLGNLLYHTQVFCGVADHGHCSLFHSGLLSFYFDLFRSCGDSDAHIPILIYIIIVHFVICIYIIIYIQLIGDAHIPKYCMCICFCNCCCCRWCCCRFFFFAPWGMLQRYPGTLILVSHDRSLWPDDPMHRQEPGFLTQRGIQNSERLPFGFNGDSMV